MTDVDDYSVLLTTRGLAGLEAEVYKTALLMEADGTPGQATILKHAYERLLRDLDDIALEISAKAKQYIVEAERRSRFRPSPTGGGQPLLEDYLGESAPLPTVNGSVGINDEKLLYDNVSWWWTQEVGYAGHVGRQVTGFFFDAGYSNASSPDPSQSRQHPLFMAGSDQRSAYASAGFTGGAGKRGGSGRRMTIRNPILARHFVLDGSARAEAEWHGRVRRARVRFNKEIDRLIKPRI